MHSIIQHIYHTKSHKLLWFHFQILDSKLLTLLFSFWIWLIKEKLNRKVIEDLKVIQLHQNITLCIYYVREDPGARE